MWQGDVNGRTKGGPGSLGRGGATPLSAADMPMALSRLTLDPSAPEPIYKQISRGVRDAILAGSLPLNTTLPTAAAFSAYLGVARNTVVAAYAQLTNDGYICANTRRGTRVAMPARFPAAKPKRAARANVRLGIQAERYAEKSVMRYADGSPFCLSTVDAAFYPRTKLGQKIAKCFLAAPDSFVASKPAEMHNLYRRFRETIRSNVLVSRGIDCTEDQIIPVAGPPAALDLIIRVLLDPGHSVMLPTPSLDCVTTAMAVAGVHLEPLECDGEGPVVPLDDSAPPRLIFTQPSGQFPYGTVYSEARRDALVAWAAARNAIVFEDDSSHVFMRHGRTLRSLFERDGRERTIYFGALGEYLGLGTDIGFLVVPEALVDSFRDMAVRLYRYPLPQIAEACAAMIEQNEMSQQLKEVRGAYAARVERFGALLLEMGVTKTRSDPGSGIHYVVELAECHDERTICQLLRLEGNAVAPLSHYRLDNDSRRGVIVSLRHVKDAGLVQLATRLAELLAWSASSSPAERV